MADNSLIKSGFTVSPKTGTGNATLTIAGSERTGRLDADAVTFTATLDKFPSVSKSFNVIQKGKPEFIAISGDSTFSVAKEGGSVTLKGISNSSKLTFTTNNASISIDTYIVGAGISATSGVAIDGDPGATAQYNFSVDITVPVNPFPDVNDILVTATTESGQKVDWTLNQAASVFTYKLIPKASVSTIPASGGSSTITAILEEYRNGSKIDSSERYPTECSIPTGTEFTVDNEVAPPTVSAPNRGTTAGDERSVTVTVRYEDQYGRYDLSSDIVISQEKNEVTNYGEVNFSSRVPSVADIPASGGSVDKADITWSGTGAIVTQKITYSSGAEVTISDEDGAIHIAYGDPITAVSKGTVVSARTEAGVITMIADGEGDKTATKTLTVYQAANSATYGDVTIGQATPVSIAASGETYQIVPAMKQTVTYTSGATRTESTPADNKVQLSAKYVVKTAKEGFSLETNSGKVTVAPNLATAPREGFVVTISATGEGSKSATKDITFNQEAAAAYLTVSPTTIDFAADGSSTTLTIESNDSWTIS